MHEVINYYTDRMCGKRMKFLPIVYYTRIYAVTGTECAPPSSAQVQSVKLNYPSTSSGMIVVFEGRQSL